MRRRYKKNDQNIGVKIKCPPGNDKDVGSNPANTRKAKIGHWKGPLNKRCTNRPAGSEWKTNNVKAELDL